MQHSGRLPCFAAAALCVAVLIGCAGGTSDPGGKPALIAAPYPPPAKRAEIPPPAPSADALWSGGHWKWAGSKYVWISGSYIQRPAPTANWMPGYWEQSSAGWIWTEGHWQS
jgi:hypothetical protein